LPIIGGSSGPNRRKIIRDFGHDSRGGDEMALMRWDPTDFDRWRDDMWRMFGRMRDDWNLDNTRPRTHLHQIDNGYLVEFELPGVDPSQVDVEIDEESVSVRGEFPAHPLESDQRGGETFHAVVSFPTEIDPESATAEYRHGLLAITAYKARGRRRRLELPAQTSNPPPHRGQ
jgi:HSP20 family protein